MNKNTMIATATQLMLDNKASKKLTAAVLLLLEDYSKTSNNDTVKHEKNITLDGIDYRWCNRHAVYEPTTNFKQKDSCKLAVKVWSEFGSRIKKLQTRLDVELDMEELDTKEIKSLNIEIKELKEVRGGRYDFESNLLQFPGIKDYIYDTEKFIKSETIES